MPDSKLFPHKDYDWIEVAKYGRDGHTAIAIQNRPGMTMADAHTHMLKIGHVPVLGEIGALLSRPVRRIRTKDILFDGYKLELHIPLDEETTIQEKILVRVPPSHEHPDKDIVLKLPKDWKLECSTLFNNKKIPEGVFYVYRSKVGDLHRFFCEYLKYDKRHILYGSFGKVKNFALNHRTMPISTDLLEELHDDGAELWSMNDHGQNLSKILGKVKKK